MRKPHLGFVLMIIFLMAYFTIAYASRIDKQQVEMKSIYHRGTDFCEWISYYGTTDPTIFCQTSKFGTVLVFAGSIVYILLWLTIIGFAFFLFKLGRDI